MKTIEVWKVCGSKFFYFMGVFMGECYRTAESFIVPLTISAKSQWRRETSRINRLLSKGNRMRGDVLAV